MICGRYKILPYGRSPADRTASDLSSVQMKYLGLSIGQRGGWDVEMDLMALVDPVLLEDPLAAS